MSDLPAGPGWWQASDGAWYPPQPEPARPPGTPGPNGSHRGPSTKSRTPLVLIGVGAAVVLIIGAVVLFSGGDSEKKEAVTAGGGSERATTIAASKADVQVLEKGFATAPESYDRTVQAVSGAAVIVNNSAVASGTVKGTFTFLGADGTPWTTETDFITFLDPGEKAYLDVDTQLPVGNSVAMLAVSLDVDITPYRDTTHVFPTSDVHIEWTSSSGVEAAGSVANDLNVTVDEVRIDCVFRSADGKLLTGDTTFSDVMDPGQMVAFEAVISSDLVPTAASADCRAAWGAITEVGPRSM